MALNDWLQSGTDTARIDAAYNSARGTQRDGSLLGGIIDPVPVLLTQGQHVFRFVAIDCDPAYRLTGGWWLTMRDMLRHVYPTARNHPRTKALWDQFRDAPQPFMGTNGQKLKEVATIAIRIVAREMLAVLPGWSDMNSLVHATIKQDTWALTGEGRPVPGGTGGRVLGIGSPVQQVFVPEARTIGNDAFRFVSMMSTKAPKTGSVSP